MKRKAVPAILGPKIVIMAANLGPNTVTLVMSQFPMAFPLVMCDVAEEGKYRLMTPLLRGIVVKWESASGKIVEHSIFNNPFRLLVAVRLGQNDTGKSAILNQILAKEHMFSSRGEPGSEYGKPATLNGSVEFTWLTQETCKDTLWKKFIYRFYSREDNTISLLANLHGDANENADIVALLSHCFQCKYLAFVMPNCTETQWENFVTMIPSENHVSIIRVDPKDYSINELCDIQTSRITEDKTLRKVRSCLHDALTGCPVVQNVSPTTSWSRVSLCGGIETGPSQKIIEFVERNSCKSAKGYLQLQVPSLSKRNVGRLSTTTHEVVRQFIGILQSPTAVMQRAVIHLENELSRVCNSETQKVRLEFSRLKADLRQAMLNSNSNPKDIESTRKNVADTLKIIDGMNLGLEHFFREVGYLYQLQLHTKTDNNVLMLPQKVADLFLNGHPIELLDGDAGDIQMLWLNAIFKSVSEKHPKLRVYVISIIGLQSSGKSTLLNSLFACRFAVSVGRCSRGLFMRLLFLDKEIAKAYNVDAVLLIDTEGLGSPEKMDDSEAEKKDRLLATFAMGISNLAIVNVLGEYIKELTEILQIAVVTMTRLEKADIAPDILLVQHLLTEKNSEKLSQSEEQFCQAIRNAIDLAEKKDVQVGVRNTKCLRELFARIQNGTLLTQFHPYKDGATANAPASETYHEDVICLYEKILVCCRSSKTVIEFSRWKTLLESYWECVTQEDFALRFKNVKEVHDFIDRGQRIAEAKQAIDAAFSTHARKQKARIVGKMRNDKSSQNREHLIRELEKHFKSLPNGCNSAASEKCPACKEACERQKSLYEYVQDKPYEIETQTTISKFTEAVQQSTIRKLSQSFDALVLQEGCCEEFDNIITTRLRKHLSRDAVGKFSDSMRKSIINEIIAELWKTAREKDHDVPVRDKIAEALLYEYRAFPDMLDRFNGEIKKFEDIFTGKQGKLQRFFGGNQRENEVEYLKSMIDSLLRKMLEQRKAECYEEGMVGELNQTLTNHLDSVGRQKVRLSAEEKLNIHVWTLQQFCKRMEDMQAAWDKKNKPSSILNENKERYIQIIVTRLDHGFTCAAEGQIIGQHLLRAIQQKAISAENVEKVRAVEGLVWTTNSEKVRLKYFKHLAEEVASGKQDAALAHFLNPTEKIEDWYKETVDEHRSPSFGKTFERTFEQEFTSVLHKVENAVDSTEVVSITQKYSTSVESMSYQPSPNFSSVANSNEFEVIKVEIVNTMKMNKKKFCCFEEKLFSQPSTDAGVMSRLGCTARCYWCGALCWGQRGHDENQGETRKHHSSHQPRGLARVGYRGTDHLVSRPCHEMTDDLPVWFGKYHDTDSGILWKEAKEKHFSDWKFDRHYNAKFDALMRWFFSELHHGIAKQCESRKPATPEDLKRFNCTNLCYEDIMSRIEQEIN